MGKRRNPRRNKNTLSFGHFPIWGEGPPAKIGFDTLFRDLFSPIINVYEQANFYYRNYPFHSSLKQRKKRTTFSRRAKVKKLPKLRALSLIRQNLLMISSDCKMKCQVPPNQLTSHSVCKSQLVRSFCLMQLIT